MRFGNINEGEMVDYPTKARKLVQLQVEADILAGRDSAANGPISLEDVYVVWFTYTLGNWKAVVSTTIPNDRIYEVTHNRAKDETYVDTYQKTSNRVFKH